jgi:S1-C subfamily serine protease
VNNHQTATLQSARDLVRGFKPGTPVTLQIQREGKLMYVSFTID